MMLQFPRPSISVGAFGSPGEVDSDAEGESMRGMRRSAVLGGASLAAAVAIAALAGGSVAQPTAQPPIVIGYSADLVGQMSPFDTPALTAAQLEVAKINARGGVL